MTKEQLTQKIHTEAMTAVADVMQQTANPHVTVQDATNVFIYIKLAELQLQINEQKHYGLYQLCPKCNGQKTVSVPPYIDGDTRELTVIGEVFQCDICKGEGIIPRPEIKSDKS